MVVLIKQSLKQQKNLSLFARFLGANFEKRTLLFGPLEKNIKSGVVKFFIKSLS